MAASSASCGGGTPPAATSPSPSAAASAAPIAEAPPDLSEVAEPAELVALLRWKSPQASLDIVSQWLGLHLSATELAAEGLDRALAEVLRLDAPVDAAVALDPDPTLREDMPLAAVAVGAKSLEDARRAAGASTPVGPGRYRVQLGHGKKDDLPSCILSVAAGAAPARFVCGRRERDIEMLSPYLTRTLPRREPSAADLHLEVRAAPLFSAYGPAIEQGLRVGAALLPRKLEVGEPAFDRAVSRVALGVTEELGALAADLDTLSIDLAVRPENARAEVSLGFRHQQSWTASLLAAETAKADAAPPMFYRLPRKSTSATYIFPAEMRRFDGIRRAFGELIDGWLVHEGIGTADRAAVLDLFSEKYSSEAPWVSASGSFERPAPKAQGKTRAPAGPAAGDDLGWHVSGVDAPNKGLAFFKSLAAALGRPRIQAYLKAKLGSDGPKPNAKSAPLTIKSVPPAKELPKGSLSYDLSISSDLATTLRSVIGRPSPAGSGGAQAQPLKVVLLVVPEPDGKTWLLWGSDRSQLSGLARAIVETKNQDDTLAARSELSVLRDEKLVGGGFTTLEDWIGSWLNQLSPAPAGARDRQALLASTPNQGKTPMLLRSRVAAASALTLSADLTIPRGAIEDAVIFATTSALLGATSP